MSRTCTKFTTDPASKNMSTVTSGNKRPAEENSVRIRRMDKKEMKFSSIEINLVGYENFHCKELFSNVNLISNGLYIRIERNKRSIIICNG